MPIIREMLLSIWLEFKFKILIFAILLNKSSIKYILYEKIQISSNPDLPVDFSVAGQPDGWPDETQGRKPGGNNRME
jgi:hypothetical protein